MSIQKASEFFENHESIRRVLAVLVDVGLGYLSLGQPSTTLSGGEAQRIKLATELSRGGAGHTLYILDEPTTGLHSADIRRLLAVLNRLVDQDNSVLVIEHNLDVIKSADWLIDLGPEGGAGGGRIVMAGTPEDVATCDASHTGQFLRGVLS
jgi:excinuclease ABC subunit A